MSYDLYLFHAEEGVDLLETIHSLMDQEESGEWEADETEYGRQQQLMRQMVQQKHPALLTIDQMSIKDIARFTELSAEQIQQAYNDASDILNKIGIQTFLSDWMIVVSVHGWDVDNSDYVGKQLDTYLKWLQGTTGYHIYDPQIDRIEEL